MTFLRDRAVDTLEQMDRPDCDPAKLERTYTRFPLVNRAFSGWGGIYRHRLRPLLEAAGGGSILDVGCGGGDIARGIARMARADGLVVDVTGIDPDERALRFASASEPVEGVSYRQADSSALVAEGRKYDVVLSNHVLHHLSAPEFSAVLHDSELLARRLALHNDINRSPLAWGLFCAGVWPLGFGSYIWQDGLTSIRRSYTAQELRDAAPSGWSVERNRPWHNLLVYRPRGIQGA